MFKPQVKIIFEPIAFTCAEVGLITRLLDDSPAESIRVAISVQTCHLKTEERCASTAAMM